MLHFQNKQTNRNRKPFRGPCYLQPTTIKSNNRQQITADGWQYTRYCYAQSYINRQ